MLKNVSKNSPKDGRPKKWPVFCFRCRASQDASRELKIGWIMQNFMENHVALSDFLLRSKRIFFTRVTFWDRKKTTKKHQNFFILTSNKASGISLNSSENTLKPFGLRFWNKSLLCENEPILLLPSPEVRDGKWNHQKCQNSGISASNTASGISLESSENTLKRFGLWFWKKPFSCENSSMKLQNSPSVTVLQLGNCIVAYNCCKLYCKPHYLYCKAPHYCKLIMNLATS